MVAGEAVAARATDFVQFAAHGSEDVHCQQEAQEKAQEVVKTAECIVKHAVCEPEKRPCHYEVSQQKQNLRH